MPLAFAKVTAPSTTPSRWMLLLHGILGRGGNWRTVARRFVEARPAWGAALVDLRLHGQSRPPSNGAGEDLAPPHTVAACAADLDGVARLLDGPVDGVLGHSFGGKVALAYTARRGGDLSTCWVVDANPGGVRADASTDRALGFLRSLPPSLTSRDELVTRADAAGLGAGLGTWLAMNLAPTSEGRFALAIDLDAVDALLESYFATDLWPVVEEPPGRVAIDLVIGARSSAFSSRDRARAEAAQAGGRVRVHTLPTGHWVHADDPEGMTRLLVDGT